MNIINGFNDSNCCGCTACKSICPKNAITMKRNLKGYYVPFVDENLCVNCGLCVTVCDFKKEQLNANKPTILACRNIKKDEILTSRSGAFFIVLSEWILNKNGYVFGCEMVDKKTIIHKWYKDCKDIKRFKGSKYVQSDLKNTFVECKEILLGNNYVLFSGTACQIAGLISYLKLSKIDLTKLITSDIICHGVPSPGVWDTNVDVIEEIYGKNLVWTDFRNKKIYGWKEHVESYYFEDNTRVDLKNWTNAFYSHLIFRDSCYKCKYTSIHRKSDFTLGDCWGVEKINEELDDNKGVSLVFLNTEKSRTIFEDLKDKIIFFETHEGVIMQPNLQYPSSKGIEFDYFWKKYLKNPKKTFKYFFYPNKIQKFYRRCRRKIIKIFLRKKTNYI